MKKRIITLFAGGLLLFGSALKATDPALDRFADGKPFAWNQDQFWEQLETRFIQAQDHPPETLNQIVAKEMAALGALIRDLEAATPAPDNSRWKTAESAMLELAPLVAADPRHLPAYAETVQNLEKLVKNKSLKWSADSPATRERLYRILYAGRAALEEILLQAPTHGLPALQMGPVGPSPASSITLHGITIHSGDILVSRGGAPTSALIARGSDYPGNFSHAALAYVDPESGEAAVIEALIEKGVVITSAADYLEDKKLRIMVLRPRGDLNPLKEDPLKPHKAAAYMADQVRRRHIPYDFAMDFGTHDKMFCSEVVYAAYQQVGIKLWTGLSRISAPGTARWLAGFGVSHFVTLEPSDLEYDPQLVKIAEWRDPETLFKAHLDNAVTDALLTGANAGDELEYDWYLLPVAHVAKAYSAIKNSWGGRGPIPQGMGATAALRNRWYSNRHDHLVGRVTEMAAEFESQNGYRPPYWELVKMARRANQES